MDRQIGPYFKIEIQGSMGSMDRQIRPYFNIAMQVSIGRQIGPYFKIWFIWIRSFEQLRTLNWSEIGQFWLKIGHFSVWVIESIWYRYDMRSAYIQPQGGEKCPFQIFTLRFGHIIFRTINFQVEHFNLFWYGKSLISNWKQKIYLHFFVFVFWVLLILGSWVLFFFILSIFILSRTHSEKGSKSVFLFHCSAVRGSLHPN